MKKIFVTVITIVVLSVPALAEDVFTRDMILRSHSPTSDVYSVPRGIQPYIPEKAGVIGFGTIAGLILSSIFAEEPTASFIRHSGATNVKTHYWFLGQKKKCKGIGGGSPLACTTWNNASDISTGELALANISTDIFKTIFAEDLRQATRGYEGTHYALMLNAVAITSMLEVCAHAASFVDLGIFTPDEATSVEKAWGKNAKIGYHAGSAIVCVFEVYMHGKDAIRNIAGKSYTVAVMPWEKIGINVGPFIAPAGDVGYGLEYRYYF
ncbi:MAG: hypothetical protein COU47_01335 [Candidatus Niyogibacteria bacterium CG10_big_fil_rev_8_21_14_0_10_46_36]|uniref:Uncharacterized protein n=1 Tax=Candidatus Niyogibacteria bacterium CG10_big_fil_rev_8_21_14_0_10_46_36 TaxID=1974726 RepID=A0A2H0TDU2_9BACT|nr:MAG: hypothetical protein COU47_01335 [Candidatus Niyogibacteria bacterium CG10_big_fil_rev_8_21_14_0_10_46_36]